MIGLGKICHSVRSLYQNCSRIKGACFSQRTVGKHLGQRHDRIASFFVGFMQGCQLSWVPLIWHQKGYSISISFFVPSAGFYDRLGGISLIWGSWTRPGQTALWLQQCHLWPAGICHASKNYRHCRAPARPCHGSLARPFPNAIVLFLLAILLKTFKK